MTNQHVLLHNMPAVSPRKHAHCSDKQLQFLLTIATLTNSYLILRNQCLCKQAVVTVLGRAASAYTRKNMRILYDALGTLADAVGRALGDPVLLKLFMPPLLDKWQLFSDTDRELMPLLECLTSLATAVGELLSSMQGCHFVIHLAQFDWCWW